MALLRASSHRGALQIEHALRDERRAGRIAPWSPQLGAVWRPATFPDVEWIEIYEGATWLQCLPEGARCAEPPAGAATRGPPPAGGVEAAAAPSAFGRSFPPAE